MKKMEERKKLKHRKSYRYTGIRPGKPPGSFIIDYSDHNGKRHQIKFNGSEKDAVKQRRMLLAKRDRIMGWYRSITGTYDANTHAY